MLKLFQEFTENDEYQAEWSAFDAERQHIPCIGHVMNLAAQEIFGKKGLQSPALKEVLPTDNPDGAIVLDHATPTQT
ncbi:hypothetical protein MVEG_04030 [Podila verticillata NRRL 6337]|nr:hypothetical protein MVEG_04030 [Podila verticillata NRRL 6337]